jgi:transposase-like protein
MFVNVDKLHGKIREMKTNVVEVAAKMGIDKSTLYRKLAKNGAGLTVKDAQQLVEILQMTNEEALLIFFARKVA